MGSLILTTAFSSILWGRVELFCDWIPDAKGGDLFHFDPQHRETDMSLLSRIAYRFSLAGEEVISWDLSHYRPSLMTWAEIHSRSDALDWVRASMHLTKPDHESCLYWIFWSFGSLVQKLTFSQVPKEKMILILWEPPTVQPWAYEARILDQFGKVFTWHDGLVDGRKFFKIHYPILQLRRRDIQSFEDKKFCVMVARRLSSQHPQELYSKREQMIRFFEQYPEEFDLYGHYWEKRQYRSWKGVWEGEKGDLLKRYKFCICYENMRDIPGYVTEKIFDCLAAGVIPIYWGASNIEKYVPPDCWIDRRQFASEEALYTFLKSIDSEMYQKYLDRAEIFLTSKEAQLFSHDHFVESMFKALQPQSQD